MKIIITLLLCSTTLCFSQLTVKPSNTGDNNFIYVKDEVLFVKEDVKLEKNDNPDIANIYLRYEGQLIQGSSGNSQNAGNGVLSVFQEGTTNEFAYNYWGAPIGDPTLSPTGNTDFGITLLHTPYNTRLSTPINPIGGYTSYTGNPVEIAKYWIYKFDDGTGYSSWEQVLDATNIPAGFGFTMKGVNGTDTGTIVDGVPNNPGSAQRYDFRGRPRNGDIEISLIEDNEYLVGNPYPSALDLSYFLLENSVDPASSGSNLVTLDCTDDPGVTRRNAITGIAYFWDSDPSVNSHYLVDYVGGFESFAPVACNTTGIYEAAAYHMYDEEGVSTGATENYGAERSRRYAPIGQGFVVFASEDSNSNLQFKNSHRIFVQENTETSEFHRFSNQTQSAQENELEVVPKMRLNVVFNDQYTRQIALGFWHTATDGIDAAMDAKNVDAIASDAGWFHDGENFIIDVRQFDATQQIPLFLSLDEEKTLKFKVHTNHFENFDTEHVYILDNLSQTYHPIKDQTFTITLPEGEYHERFKLTFLNEEELEDYLDIDNEIKYSLDVFQNNHSAQLEIRNPNNVQVKSIEMYDLTGKQIFSEQELETKDLYTFPTRNLQSAIYLVKITTSDNKDTIKKVSISN